MPGGEDKPGARSSYWRIAGMAAATLVMILVLGCLGFYASGLYAAGVSGRVGLVENPDAPQESWRFVPAADTQVVITWGASSRCLRAVLTRTDDDGAFEVPGRWLAPAWPPRSMRQGYAYANKSGYFVDWNLVHLAAGQNFTIVLGPPPRNPWTGVPIPDEDPLQNIRWRACPIEQL